MKCIEDEIPFEIPQDWEWTRLGSIAIIKGGKRIPKGMGFSDTKTDHIYIRVVDMKNNSVNLNNLKYISDEVFSRLKNYTVKKNDLYITIAGTIGEVGEIPEELDGMNLTENAAKITGVKVYKSFLCLFLQADFLKKQFNYKTYQVAMPKLGLERIQSVLIPICGTKMQHKIVTSVRELLNSIESIHTNQADIIDDIKLIKSSILDLAIRGKLIPQDPNDEPASVLLERIRAEKEELIKQGKIKRDKKESVIFKGEDNSYYQDLPKNWTITTLADITTPLTLNDGDWILSENMDDDGNVKLIQLGAIGKMQYIDKGFKFISDKTFNDLKCSQVYSGFLLINRIISDAMNVCILPTIEGKIITTVDTCWIAPNENNYSLKYLMFMLSSSIVQSKIKFMSSGTTRKRISKNNLIKIPFPFPPIAEQHRIVYAIETYFSTLDKISNSLS